MQTLVPHLSSPDAKAAIAFYKKAFGATEDYQLPAPDGKRILHCQLTIGDSALMLADQFPEYSGNCEGAAKEYAPTGAVTLHINSPDVDKTIADAVAAGAALIMPPADMFWGDRYGQIRDPFGQRWSVGTPIKKLSPDQIKSAADETFKQHPPKNATEQQQQQQ